MKITDYRFISIFTLIICIWGVLFYPALISMEDTWRHSNTFAHGYFIFPIVIWMFWRDKAYLLNSLTSTSWLAVPIILGSLFVALFSYAADINVLIQLAAVTCLIGIFWLLFGNQLTWHYKFPLAYLIFLVPMGENLIPALQDVTAWFTVTFLNWNGIPVYRDGLYLQTPTGLFEVAVACSGIRFLIASGAVGTLYAYLSYKSVKKQAIFIIFSFVLPIIANGVRAYLIVAIAHYSNMEYATGADHLIYGWVFFGFVIMLMFWVGGKFADPELTEQELASKALDKQTSDLFSFKPVIFLIPVLALSFVIKESAVVVKPPTHPESLFVHLAEVDNSNWGINFKSPLKRSHVKLSNNTEVYKAVYAHRQSSGELISSSNAFHDIDSWTVIDSKVINVASGEARVVHLRDMRGNPRSYIYQYIIGDSEFASANKAKLFQAWKSLTAQTDSDVIIALSIVGISDLLKAEMMLIDDFSQLDKMVTQ